jgi:hypothetical protein
MMDVGLDVAGIRSLISVCDPKVVPGEAEDLETQCHLHDPRVPCKAARVQFTDRSWRPCEVIAWYAGTNIMSTSSRLWYAQLRLLADGHGQVSEGWFAYNPQYLRPR